MNSEHLTASRGWVLIRDNGELTPLETKHLKECSQCHDWFTTFAANARTAGFAITFSIPALSRNESVQGA